MSESSRRIGTAVAVALLLALSPGCDPASSPPSREAAQEADAGPYHILVTNDDGIGSRGIRSLADALRAVGEVTVGGAVRADERKQHVGAAGA